MFPWRGKRVLITAGPTREPLDPVRYITNASSGKMGFALAEAARKRGARVTLVAGPTSEKPPKGVTVTPVETAQEMLRACLKALPGTDLIIGAAAVGDFRSARPSRRKIKKAPGSTGITLRLIPNPDILAALSRRRKGGRPALAGFALETGDLLTNARAKMARKGLDLIVANGPGSLDGDQTKAIILTRQGRSTPFKGAKKDLAEKILSAAEAFL